MAEIKDYSVTADDNNATSPNGMPENMAPSGVNNSWRESFARVKRWYEDINATKSTTGSSNAYVLAAARTVTAYAQGDAYMFRANHTNTAAVTLNIDSVGAVAVVNTSQSALAAGQIQSGGIYLCAYDGTNSKFQLVGASSTSASGDDIFIYNASPSATLENSTAEDTAGGRESTIQWKGLQSGSEESTLVKIIGSHDGTSDDQKGKLQIYTNDGNDGDSPTLALTIDSAGLCALVGQVTATGFTGTLDGILGSGTAAAASVTTLTTSGIASIDDTTDTTSGTTGSIHTDGGVGVAKALYVGTTAKIIGVTTHGDDVVSDTDSTDDLGTTGVRWANLFVDAITATDQITATGFTGTLDGILGSGAAAAATTTTLDTSGVVNLNLVTDSSSSTSGALIIDGGVGIAKKLFVGTDADVDGTLEADAITLNGTALGSLYSPIAGGSSIVTTGALNSGSITSGFGAIDNGASAITTTGVITGGTVEATTDTAAADNAAIGYTAAEGLILTGQGSTNDVTIKNDADADVIEIPTGTTNVTVAGTLGTGGAITSGAGLVIANAGTIGSASVTDAIIIDAAGRIQVSGTAVVDVARLSVSFNGADSTGVSLKALAASGGTIMRYQNSSGTSVGGITTNGTTTAFATSSDYRLKENVDYTWDATTRLKQLKPARFNFIADESNTLVDGFIAHEVSSIVPEAIIGEKDATEMQSIDQSKLVPLLVKTIQELEARITALEAS